MTNVNLPVSLQSFAKYVDTTPTDPVTAQTDLLGRLVNAKKLVRTSEYTSKYPSIPNLFARHNIPNQGDRYDMTRIEEPLVEELAMNQWIVTEKIDGVNVRVGWNGVDTVTYAGREHKRDNLPAAVADLLHQTFTRDLFTAHYPGQPITLYCEVFGPKLGVIGHLYGEALAVRLLDVHFNGAWSTWQGVKLTGDTLRVPLVPTVTVTVLPSAAGRVYAGLRSLLAPPGADPVWAEGVVARPFHDLRDARGNPIRVKIKHCYFHGSSKRGRMAEPSPAILESGVGAHLG